MTHGYKIDKVQLDLIQYASKANVDAKLFPTFNAWSGHSNLQNNLDHTMIYGGVLFYVISAVIKFQ